MATENTTPTQTTESVNNINQKLGQVFTEEQSDELYLAEYELQQRMVHDSGIPEWVSEIYN